MQNLFRLTWENVGSYSRAFTVLTGKTGVTPSLLPQGTHTICPQSVCETDCIVIL